LERLASTHLPNIFLFSILSLILFIVFTPSVYADPISFDDVSSFNGNCDPCTFSHTVTSAGGNRTLIVGISYASGATVSTVTYDSQPLTNIRSDEYSGVVHSELWYIVDPSTGPNTVAVDFSTSGNVVIGAISFTGVDQDNPINVHNGDN